MIFRTLNLFKKVVSLKLIRKLVICINPKIMKLDTNEFKGILTNEVRTLQQLFEENGHELRIAGGAVRDLLLGIQPKDLDFATTATPDQMKEFFDKNNIRMINMNGERHGTITPRINDCANFEVTTLRIDVVTDGRRAEVEFTKDWQLDANRRDLTINSMFLGLDGTLYDFFDGYEDLKNRRVRFVGDARTRIQEDYLRILRYFRFYGRISLNSNSHDEETLEAIRQNSGGLKNISGERIWMELHKILEGNFAGELLAKIIDLQIAPVIGLPEDGSLEELHSVWTRSCENRVRLKAITLLCAYLNSDEQFMAFHSRVKLSTFDRDLGLFVIKHRQEKPHENPIKPYQMLMILSQSKPADTRQYIEQTLLYRGSLELAKEFMSWNMPKFPVNGNMIRAAGVTNGRQIGFILQALKKIWADSDFSPGSDELIMQIADIQTTLSPPPEKKKKVVKK